MKNKRIDSYERLFHIQESIHMIEAFIREINKEAFLNDRLVASAVLFQFSVIGEAVVHIEENLLSKYEYPWYKVRAFRNLISHMYFQIKLDAVWDMIIKDLPVLKQVIETILNKEFL